MDTVSLMSGSFRASCAKGSRPMMRVAVVCAACLSLLVFAASLEAARMHHLHTGDMLDMNDVALRTGLTSSITSSGEYRHWLQEVIYGISDDVNFILGVPLVSLGGIDNSLILGDMDFQVQARLAQWETENATMLSSVWLLVGWRAGLGVESGEGKTNPESGLLQTYAPWATGRSSFWLGGGYSFPLAGLAGHVNFTYWSETGRSGDPLEFVLRDDHIELGGSLEYTFEIEPDIFGSPVNIGIRPLYEMVLRFAWDESSSMPSRLENTFGIWLRIGPVFRLMGGMNFPVALESPRYLKREYFFSITAVFR